jgi:hypothetical protein
MDSKTHHLFKPVMIGRIGKDGAIVPISVTEGLVPPEPWSPWLAPAPVVPPRPPEKAPLAAQSAPFRGKISLGAAIHHPIIGSTNCLEPF